MSEGLEALKYLKENKRRHWLEGDNSNECLNCIEKELEDLDTIKEIFSQYGLEYKLTSAREALLLLKQYQGSYGVRGQALITKKLKALELIKENDVDIFALKVSIDLKQYNCKEDGRSPLTQKEYDLLKEVLL